MSKAQVGGGDLHDAIGVNLERDLGLRNTRGGGRDAGELDLAKEVVVLGGGAFTLKDLDQDSRLVVSSGGEDLALAGGDDSVTIPRVRGVDIDENDIAQVHIASGILP